MLFQIVVVVVPVTNELLAISQALGIRVSWAFISGITVS